MATTSPWLFRFKENPNANLRLFCFPYAGGGINVFRGWDKYLSSSVEICAVQLPGREMRLKEPAYRRLNLLMPILVEGLYGSLDRPFAIFGHSMGALIAFELSRELRRRNLALPRQLIVSARPAPQLDFYKTSNHLLSEADFIKRLREIGGTPPAVLSNPELLEIMLPVIRADFELTETYEYYQEPRLDCDITVFGGRLDGGCPLNVLEPWQLQTNGSFKLKLFEGGHFYLQEQRETFLQALSVILMNIA